MNKAEKSKELLDLALEVAASDKAKEDLWALLQWDNTRGEADACEWAKEQLRRGEKMLDRGAVGFLINELVLAAVENGYLKISALTDTNSHELKDIFRQGPHLELCLPRLTDDTPDTPVFQMEAQE